MLLVGKAGTAATYIGRAARRAGISVTWVDVGRLSESRKAWITFWAIAVTTCIVAPVVMSAVQISAKRSRIEGSLLERTEIGACCDMAAGGFF